MAVTSRGGPHGNRRGLQLLAGKPDFRDHLGRADFLRVHQRPQGKNSGTKMVYVGLKDETRIKDLIAFFKQFDAAKKKTQ